MKRKPFLYGVLTGSVLGMGMTLVASSLAPESQPSQPASPILTNDLPQKVIISPTEPTDVPPDWRKKEFNGQPYYIIPLS